MWGDPPLHAGGRRPSGRDDSQVRPVARCDRDCPRISPMVFTVGDELGSRVQARPRVMAFLARAWGGSSGVEPPGS